MILLLLLFSFSFYQLDKKRCCLVPLCLDGYQLFCFSFRNIAQQRVVGELVNALFSFKTKALYPLSVKQQRVNTLASPVEKFVIACWLVSTNSSQYVNVLLSWDTFMSHAVTGLALKEKGNVNSRIKPISNQKFDSWQRVQVSPALCVFVADKQKANLSNGFADSSVFCRSFRQLCSLNKVCKEDIMKY